MQWIEVFCTVFVLVSILMTWGMSREDMSLCFLQKQAAFSPTVQKYHGNASCPTIRQITALCCCLRVSSLAEVQIKERWLQKPITPHSSLRLYNRDCLLSRHLGNYDNRRRGVVRYFVVVWRQRRQQQQRSGIRTLSLDVSSDIPP